MSVCKNTSNEGTSPDVEWMRHGVEMTPEKDQKETADAIMSVFNGLKNFIDTYNEMFGCIKGVGEWTFVISLCLLLIIMLYIGILYGRGILKTLRAIRSKRPAGRLYTLLWWLILSCCIGISMVVTKIQILGDGTLSLMVLNIISLLAILLIITQEIYWQMSEQRQWSKHKPGLTVRRKLHRH